MLWSVAGFIVGHEQDRSHEIWLDPLLVQGSSAERYRAFSFFFGKSIRLEPFVFDLVYRISCVSSAYVLKSDMNRCSPVDAVVIFLESIFFLESSRRPQSNGRSDKEIRLIYSLSSMRKYHTTDKHARKVSSKTEAQMICTLLEKRKGEPHKGREKHLLEWYVMTGCVEQHIAGELYNVKRRWRS